MTINCIKLIIITLVAFVISCDNNKTDINTPYQIDESLGYFPLNIENSWTYKSEQNSYEQKVEVNSKYELNNKEYFIISTLGEHSYPDTIRIEDNKVLKIFGNEEIIWFDFDLQNGSEYQYKNYNVRAETGITVQTHYGEFINCIGFYFDVPGIADEEIGYVFAKGVGVVRMPGAWVDLKLLSFVINN